MSSQKTSEANTSQTCCKMQSDAGMPKRRPLKELQVDGKFTEDRMSWKEELHKHCEETYEDIEKTFEMEEDGVKKYRTYGDRHFTEDRGVAEITVDLVLQAMAKMVEERVNGPEDSIVTEMIKQFPPANLRNCKMLPRPLDESGRGVQLREDREIALLAKAGC